MSIVSPATMGAMASKKARSASPVRARLASPRAGAVGGAGGNDVLIPLRRGQACGLVAGNRDIGFVRKALRDMLRKAVAIDRKRAPSRHFMRIGRGEDERVEPSHLAMQDADRARLR